MSESSGRPRGQLSGRDTIERVSVIRDMLGRHISIPVELEVGAMYCLSTVCSESAKVNVNVHTIGWRRPHDSDVMLPFWVT